MQNNLHKSTFLQFRTIYLILYNVYFTVHTLNVFFSKQINNEIKSISHQWKRQICSVSKCDGEPYYMISSWRGRYIHVSYMYEHPIMMSILCWILSLQVVCGTFWRHICHGAYWRRFENKWQWWECGSSWRRDGEKADLQYRTVFEFGRNSLW